MALPSSSEPTPLYHGGSGGIDFSRLCADPAAPTSMRTVDAPGITQLRLKPVGETLALAFGPPAPHNREAAPAATPVPFVPHALLRELLAETVAAETSSDVLTGNLLATTVLARSHQASSAPHAVVACLPCGPGGCRVATTLVTLPEPQQGAGLSASAALPRVNAIRIAAHVVAGQLPLLQLDFGEVKTPKLPLLAARSAHRVEIFQLDVVDAARLEQTRAAGVLPTSRTEVTGDAVFPVQLHSIGHVKTTARCTHAEWVHSNHAQLLCFLLDDGSVRIIDAAAATAAHESARAAKHLARPELATSTACGPDGQPAGWRGVCVVGTSNSTRSLITADGANLWSIPLAAHAKSGSRSKVFTLAGGQPTQEQIEAVCSLRGRSSGYSPSDPTSRLVVFATGRRVCIVDVPMPPQAGESAVAGSSTSAHVVLTWMHDLGDSDPPRMLSCSSAALWLPSAVSIMPSTGGDAPVDRSWFITAATSRRAAVRAFQCTFARPSDVTALQQKDSHGWASSLRECVVGARAVGGITCVPSPLELHTQRKRAMEASSALPPPLPLGVEVAAAVLNDESGGNQLSDPSCCGFDAVPPQGGSGAGISLACDREGVLYATPIMHIHRGEGHTFSLAEAASFATQAAITEPEPAPATKTGRTAGCKLPLHTALMMGDGQLNTGALQVTRADCIAAVTSSPWPLTRLEAAFSAARCATARACADGGEADLAEWVPLMRDSPLLNTAVASKNGAHRRKQGKAPAVAAREAVENTLRGRDQSLKANATLLLTQGGGDDGSGPSAVLTAPAARVLDTVDAAVVSDRSIRRVALTGAPAVHGPGSLASASRAGAASASSLSAVHHTAGPHSAAMVACAVACDGWSTAQGGTLASPYDVAFFTQHGDDTIPSVLRRSLMPMPDWADGDAMELLEQRVNPRIAASHPPSQQPASQPPRQASQVQSSQAMPPPPPRAPTAREQPPASGGARPSSQPGASPGQPPRPPKRRREGF